VSNKIQVNEEIYTHEYLWRSSTKLLDLATDDSYHYLMPSLLMSYLAFEAFINFCGYAVLPETWKNEKEHFKGKGIEGKIEEIVDLVPEFKWNKGTPPYQTVRKIADYRDMMAHGKVVASSYTAEEKEIGSHFRYDHDWDKYLTQEFVKKARDCIQSFSELLLIELREVSDHPHLIFKAYEGSLASANGHP
jgi:hypothetical protein